MCRVAWFAPVLLFPSFASAQSSVPAPLPPTLLPASAAAPVSPLARYREAGKYPPETLAAVDSFRAGTGWLAKMHQVHGRFLPGLDPALASKLETDGDAHQAVACYALSQAARLTADPALSAKAHQSVLALFAPNKGRDGAPAGEKILYAAALSLAVREISPADPKLTAAADQLVGFLKTCQSPEGLFPYSAGSPGAALAVQALARSGGSASENLLRAAAGYRAAKKSLPAAELGAALPGLVEAYAVTKDPAVAAAVFELADSLIADQLRADDPSVTAKWVGSFSRQHPPGFDAVVVARGLAAATWLSRQTSTDLTRYTKYRQATLSALAFVQTLQYTDDSTPHFDPKYRTQFLVGGIRTGVADAGLRVEATGWTLLALAAFFDSGADGRE